MKHHLIYALVSCFMLTFAACDDNIEDATSKHVYGEDESPYLKVNTNAVVTNNLEFAVGHFEPQTIQLSDYADKFEKNMNMTVDQVINGLKDGSVVFYNINTARNNWNKAEMTKGTTGWYYNSAGGICSVDDPTQTVNMEIDTQAKTFIVDVNEKATVGTVLTFNAGFAVNGPDYDKYVRFTFNVSITDPSIILTSISIPTGDYASYGIDFNKYAATIQTCMGMSVADFLANLDYNGDSGEATGKNIRMHVINPSTGVWDETSTYTAESPGYWINNLGAACNWGATGYSFYANTKNKDHALYVGRAPGLTAGSKYTISVGYKDSKNTNNFFRFIITATLE